MSTEAVDAIPHNLVELSEEDKIKQQEDLIKVLDNPDTLKKFVEACKYIGEQVVNIDNEIIHIKDDFANFVEKCGKEFPKVKSEYVPRWDGLMARWVGDSGLLWSSRNLAAETASALTCYGINLEIVAEIESEKDLKESQAELQDFVDKHPATKANIVVNGLEIFKEDIEKFSQDFQQYIKNEGKRPSKEAEEYEAEIKKYQGDIDNINEKIKKAFIVLGCSVALGIVFAIPVSAGFLADFIVQRKKMQDNLDKARANLERVKKDQIALAALQVDFENLKSRIDDICIKLGIFAGIYSFMSEESILIKNELNKGMEILSSWIFKIKLELLRKQVEPLKEGMRVYATQIVKR